jgi:hypothetical protein
MPCRRRKYDCGSSILFLFLYSWKILDGKWLWTGGEIIVPSWVPWLSGAQVLYTSDDAMLLTARISIVSYSPSFATAVLFIYLFILIYLFFLIWGFLLLELFALYFHFLLARRNCCFFFSFGLGARFVGIRFCIISTSIIFEREFFF